MEQTIIETKQGTLRGAEGNGVLSWKGVPYAQPPTGDLRFRAPQPPEKWTGIRDALAFGPICPQPLYGEASMFGSEAPPMSEDCLYLNVWAPEGERSKLPVTVWIHGGAFVTGAASIPLYEGTQFSLRGDCIVVSVNYRLGPFGFLHLSPLGQGFASNTGLLDQVLALEWVRSNIAAFGGDPENVTVFGESAGAMSIAALLAMPAARGLFRRAVMQSGAAQSMSAAQAESVAASFIRLLGVDGGNLERLNELRASELLAAADGVSRESEGGFLALPFQPVVEPGSLPADPLAAVSGGSAAGIPLLIGTNKDEGAFFFRDEAHLMGPEEMDAALRSMTGSEDTGAWLDLYPATLEGQGRMMTELYFWRSALAFAEAQSRHAPVWMYRFDWSLPGHPFFGQAVHSAEIAFVFGNLVLLPRMGVRIEPAMQNLSDAMRRAWQTFARSGSPDTPELSWPAYGAQDRTTMIFGADTLPEHDPEREKRERLSAP
ncbi:carboxylesterase/lipase family protein [Saccharibacillus sp. CPCC 101409]|uniref:carboxylesterase/lipase family protein n=1 Tax=Saccharibacillus sp. CPCC 101409 TaxID=3058041 RepID=UPI00267241C9|nr:carboxylesterase/lipase family protein [Saccharibacillus sp. CPCC 101409]MDO3408671.1 carboxylesterase/lipase family protein [Saccharibacillus sp. CPCC 101409]